MKLRLRGNTVRLRLGKAEIETLKTEGVLSEETVFAPGQSLLWTLVSSSSEKHIRTEYNSSGIHFYIPKAQAQAWANGGLVGLYSEGTPRIAIEKDFKCLEERPGEEDRDAFPNPQAARG